MSSYKLNMSIPPLLYQLIASIYGFYICWNPHVWIEIQRVFVVLYIVLSQIHILYDIGYIIAQSNKVLYVCTIIILYDDFQLIIFRICRDRHFAGHLEQNVSFDAVYDRQLPHHIEIVCLF